MKLELTKVDCDNVRVALRLLSKQPQVDEEAMKQILVLSDKFAVKPKKVVGGDKQK